jgi:hypothetical protein
VKVRPYNKHCYLALTELPQQGSLTETGANSTARPAVTDAVRAPVRLAHVSDGITGWLTVQ